MSNNLDYLAAKFAQAVVNQNKQDGRKPDDVDNLVTKALGVLQENGIYACGLYLSSRTQPKEQDIAATVRAETLKLLEALPFGWSRPTRDNTEATLTYLAEKVAGDPSLERLLLAKETLEQMFIYARYGAKAWKAEGG
jgi:hypothetical protein